MAVAWGIISQEWEKLGNAPHTTPGRNYPNHRDFLCEDKKLVLTPSTIHINKLKDIINLVSSCYYEELSKQFSH